MDYININTAALKEGYAKLAMQKDKIKSLLEECRVRNLPVDYPMVSYTVINEFLRFGTDDIKEGFFERSVYCLRALEKISDAAAAELTQYLNGEKKPPVLARYKTGRLTRDGYSFVGDAVNNYTGEAVRQPVFFLGYGHFKDVRRDLPLFPDYGLNIIQIEIGPRDVVFPREYTDRDYLKDSLFAEQGESYIYTDGEYSVNIGAIVGDIVYHLKEAEKHNMMINLLISPHYFPRWAYGKWNDVASESQGFIGYKINHERAKDIMKVYINALIPLVKDSPALHSICLSNEPTYVSSADGSNQPLWKQFLTGKFQSIEALNGNLGTNYSDLNYRVI